MASMCVIDWSTFAAWVQAVGSVIAIGAAIWIDHGTTRRQERLRQAERRDRVEGVRLALRTALNAVLAVQADFDATSDSRDLNTVDAVGRLGAAQVLVSHFVDEPGGQPIFVYALALGSRSLPGLTEIARNYHGTAQQRAELDFALKQTKTDLEEALLELDHGPFARAAGTT